MQPADDWCCCARCTRRGEASPRAGDCGAVCGVPRAPRTGARARDCVRLRAATFSRASTATRRVADYQAYVSLFSWWHVLHLPLFFLLLIAGIVHVVAVHVY